MLLTCSSWFVDYYVFSNHQQSIHYIVSSGKGVFFKLDNNQLLYKSNNHSFCSFHKMVSNMFSSALFLVEYPIGSMGLVFLRTFTIGSMHGIFSHIYNLTSTN